MSANWSLKSSSFFCDVCLKPRTFDREIPKCQTAVFHSGCEVIATRAATSRCSQSSLASHSNNNSLMCYYAIVSDVSCVCQYTDLNQSRVLYWVARSPDLFINFWHSSSSWVKIRLYTKNQLPRLSGSGLKVCVGYIPLMWSHQHRFWLNNFRNACMWLTTFNLLTDWYQHLGFRLTTQFLTSLGSLTSRLPVWNITFCVWGQQTHYNNRHESDYISFPRAFFVNTDYIFWCTQL